MYALCMLWRERRWEMCVCECVWETVCGDIREGVGAGRECKRRTVGGRRCRKGCVY